MRTTALRLLALYAVSRLVTTTFMLVMFLVATGQGWNFASHRSDPSFFTFSGSWDASFYKTIAEHGYPRELPLDATGRVRPNPWAFLPLFPAVTRVLMSVTGMDFYTAGVILASAFGAAAALMLYAVVRLRASERQARWAMIFFSFGPLSFVLQVAYAETLFLLLIFACLWAMIRRHYLLLIPLGLLAAFTRPGVLAIPLALAVVIVLRLARHQPFPWRERIAAATAGLAIAAAGLAWPVIASVVTGHPDAYLETELSWWAGFVGHQRFAPLTPWFLMAGTFLGWAGIVLVIIVIAAFVWWLTRRSLRRLGPELLSFSGGYLLYLVAVFLPQQSLLRIMMPLAPLLADPALSATRLRRRTLLAIGIGLQPVAIVLLWFLGYP